MKYYISSGPTNNIITADSPKSAIFSLLEKRIDTYMGVYFPDYPDRNEFHKVLLIQLRQANKLNLAFYVDERGPRKQDAEYIFNTLQICDQYIERLDAQNET